MVLSEPAEGDTQSRPFTPVGYLPRLYVAYASGDGKLYGIEDHFVYVSNDCGRSFERRGKLPKIEPDLKTAIKDWVARLKVVRWIRTNSGPTNLVVLNTGTILVFWGRIYRSTDGGYTFESVFEFDRDGVSDPFTFSEGITVGPGDTVYFGEYVIDSGPRPVRVFRGVDDGETWDIAYEFPSGETRHIHSVQYDPYRDVYWIATGDTDAETNLWSTDDDFESLRRLGGGSQDWRLVSLMVTPEYLYWGNDNDQTGASVFRWDFQQEKLERLQDLGKVSYHSTILKDGTLVLSTTYEPQARWVQEHDPVPSSEIWASTNGFDWKKILSLPYERKELPSGVSRAEIAFPGGAPLDRIFYRPISTVAKELTTFVIQPR